MAADFDFPTKTLLYFANLNLREHLIFRTYMFLFFQYFWMLILNLINSLEYLTLLPIKCTFLHAGRNLWKKSLSYKADTRLNVMATFFYNFNVQIQATVKLHLSYLMKYLLKHVLRRSKGTKEKVFQPKHRILFLLYKQEKSSQVFFTQNLTIFK